MIVSLALFQKSLLVIIVGLLLTKTTIATQAQFGQQKGESFPPHPQADENDILPLSKEEILQYKQKMREMFAHGYRGYLQYAFPEDELTPLSCQGRNTLGGFGVTRIDTISTLAIFGMEDEFKASVEWAKTLSFDVDQDVSIFETNIRVLGGLIGGHLILKSPEWQSLLNLSTFPYNNELLDNAVDVANRLLMAFETPSGLPVRMINLRSGIMPHGPDRIFTAEAGSFLLEFGMLSELTGNPIYRRKADFVVEKFWEMRLKSGLVGSIYEPFVNPPVWSPEQDGKFTGIGPGIDSFYEYLVKAHILFEDDTYLEMFSRYYKSIKKYCYKRPWYVGVDINNPNSVNPLVWNLDAYFPGVQVLYDQVVNPASGDPEFQSQDLRNAIETATAFHSLWQKFDFLPETYDINVNEIHMQEEEYNLRPELGETFFYLFNATKDPLWRLLGAEIITNIDKHTKTRCGFASINVNTKKRINQMESFVLSETFMYLYLLFDPENPVLTSDIGKPLVFTTEGKPFWIPKLSNN